MGVGERKLVRRGWSHIERREEKDEEKLGWMEEKDEENFEWRENGGSPADVF